MQHHRYLAVCIGIAVLAWGNVPQPATALDLQTKLDQVRSTGVADYNGAANWAYSPPLAKFVDTLPGLCNNETGATNPTGKNNLGQCIPVGVPDTLTYPGSDYYELEIVEFRERMHTDFPVLSGGSADAMTATAGGTLLRGYRQTNTTNLDVLTPHNLGVTIVATKERPVRIKFTNSLPIDAGGDLFIPTDTTVMGSGPGPTYIRDNPVTAASLTDAEVCQAQPADCFSQNRATLHLHGGRTPWISDGTAHQWVTPVGEFTGDQLPIYSKGVSVAYVPDMWFDSVTGATIGACAGQTFCSEPNATNNPGEGSQTYYWTNAQSARLMFYHEHAWGITRLGVYAGGVAGYLVTDPTETALRDGGFIPDAAHTIPLIIQDKTFVDASTIIDNPATAESNDGTDPTWIWGSQPGSLRPAYNAAGATPVTGDLWWPHVYVPAQNPYNPDFSGTNPYGRWHYGPWFWPPTDVPWGPITNPYYDTVNDPSQPPEIPSTPNPSWGAEAFLDTPVINGTAYPTLNVDPTSYRFRVLNGAHDRFWNLQLYVADETQDPVPAQGFTEVRMVPAVPTAGYPGDGDGDFTWPTDGREGGVPDPATRGPAMVQIGTEGGFLPAPVELLNRPVNWNVDVTTFTAGLVLQQNQGGGTLMMGPAERADIIVDFSDFAGKTLILYNDAPAPWPALDPHYDYYTNNPDYTDIGGAKSTAAGLGPNTRTIMRIEVSGTGGAATPNAELSNLAVLQDAFKPAPTGLGVFANGQEPIIVGQSAYNDVYDTPTNDITFPATWPNWGLSRITDTELSFMTPEGAIVTAYPMEPKAIQDEMGEVFDDFGRMSAKLGLELAKTTANIQTFVLQNFVDPPTETVAKDQIQIWKITSNGVDTHPVHFHLFEVQLLNRVGWDGFIYLPDPNEIGWKDVVRISPLEDTIVALRPAKVPTPFTVPNSIRPLNPAYPLGGPAGFTNIDPLTAQPLNPPVVNEVFNFGHEYLWHCHILSHEEQDMMRPIVLNANSLLYTLNNNGFWQWNRGDWRQITNMSPLDMVVSGTFAYADYGANGIWQWNGYDWRQIDPKDPDQIIASEAGLFAYFAGLGTYQWKNNSWTKIRHSSSILADWVASEAGLYAYFDGKGVSQWDGTTWTKITNKIPVSMTASSDSLFAQFTDSVGIYQWSGSSLTKIFRFSSSMMTASGKILYAYLDGKGIFRWDGTTSKKLGSLVPSAMTTSGSGSEVYYNVTGKGIYRWNGKQVRISNTEADSIDSSGSILYANFGGAISKWEFETQSQVGNWSLLQNTSPVSSMKAGF